MQEIPRVHKSYLMLFKFLTVFVGDIPMEHAATTIVFDDSISGGVPRSISLIVTSFLGLPSLKLNHPSLIVENTPA